MNKYTSHGFTAVELLIAIVVGIVFIGAVSQIYTVVMNDSAVARNRATASSIAYTQARTVIASLATPCSPSSATTTPSSNLPGTVSMTTVIDCPYTATYANSTISRVTVTVTYGTTTPQQKVKHVLYKY